MPRKGVTIDDVMHAMAVIKDQGKTPTVRSVREQLGTGSSSTISKYMSQARVEADSALVDIPDLPKELLEQTKNIWAACYQQANAEAIQHRKELHHAGYTFGELNDLLKNLTERTAELQNYFHEAGDSTP